MGPEANNLDYLLQAAAETDLAKALELARRGIRLVVNLNERPLSTTRLAEHGMVELHLPVHDFTAPSVEQLVRGVLAIAEGLAFQGIPTSSAVGSSPVAGWVSAR